MSVIAWAKLNEYVWTGAATSGVDAESVAATLHALARHSEQSDAIAAARGNRRKIFNFTFVSFL